MRLGNKFFPDFVDQSVAIFFQNIYGPMNNDTHINLAFCWYEPDEWLDIKKFAVDADKQDDTYEEWRANANKAIKNIRASGQNIVKISMKADEFFAWCKDNNCQNNSDARSMYAAEKLKKRKRET